MPKWKRHLVTSLRENEIFVFGSNEWGIHGAGAAGIAFKGFWKEPVPLPPNPLWEVVGKTQEVVEKPKPKRGDIGNWAVWGQARGHQVGVNGESYAIATVEKPGEKGKIDIINIALQLLELVRFARDHKDKTFYVTNVGEGLGGWSEKDMAWAWEKSLDGEVDFPPNMIFVRSR